MQGNRNAAQSELIYAYMQKNGSITPMEAMTELGCMRLGARIWELKHDRGIAIQTKDETTVNRYGRKVRYARYVLAEEEEK